MSHPLRRTVPRLRVETLLRADAAEVRRSANRYSGADDDTLAHLPGTRRVLVTAPHAVAHRREGDRKVADVGTGMLAELAASAVGAHALVADGFQTRDGNYDPDGLFKDALRSLWGHVDYVVDVHGMADRHGPDVCLGLGEVAELAAPLRAALEPRLRAAGFTVAVNDPFSATHPHTVTSASQRAGVPAIQVELAGRVRRAGRSPDRRLALVAAVAAGLVDLC